MSADAGALFVRALSTERVEIDAIAERVLDGGLACLSEAGLRRPTVEDIARRAGVARVTVYRRFENKTALVEAVLLRECRRCLVALDEAVAGVEPLEARIVEGFVFALRFAREHPLVGGLLRVEPEEVLPYLTVRAGEALAVIRDHLAAHLGAAEVGGEPARVAELMVRIVMSFVLTAESGIPMDVEEEWRAFARRYLVPLIG